MRGTERASVSVSEVSVETFIGNTVDLHQETETTKATAAEKGSKPHLISMTKKQEYQSRQYAGELLKHI